MDIQIDESEPETSIDRYVMDTIADGGKNSDAFYVPPHWHKVNKLIPILCASVRMPPGRD